ncbi:MAG: DNA-directed RNA polymerase subunit beta' [Candidatus Pacebacteria bacterium]|nr:DNA-directed RNA polymerase subunit beta' [Candidatus Paceibacterota bacterium]
MLNPIKTSDFDAIRLKVASPEQILEWSNGEVVRPETINYRTQKPEKDGLFCEKIFGPTKDWECACGKYKKIRYKGIVCDKCGVEVTRSIVRRERMAHINLQIPITHIWFLRGISSKIGLLLDLSMQSLEKVVYFASFVVIDVDEQLKIATLDQIKKEYKSKVKSIENEYQQKLKKIETEEDKSITIKDLDREKEEKLESLNENFELTQKELKDLKPMSIISEQAYQSLSLKFGHLFEAGIGAEAVRDLLAKIDLEKKIEELEAQLKKAVESKRDKLIKRLKLLKSLKNNDIRPEWMVITTLPVIPPDLRPMVALDGGRFAASDLNDLYRRVINRNNRLKQLIELNAPEVICRNEKRMLQEAVDALIDNSARHSKTVTASTGQKRQLKSLADSLKGKQGRFRQNLLGKRVDYSGRSVIVVNPKLRLDQCGLPKSMALELFKPFIISQLIKKEIVHNVRSASRYMEAGHDEVWDILENIVKEAYVLLNRAPTLHRLGIQAFKPTLIEGKAIQIHPLVCSAFNADFDGDQMAVHVPLTKEAVAEARDLMLSSHNLLKPATGDPIVAPNQDIVWGAYYITVEDKETAEKDNKDLRHFASEKDAKLAYDNSLLTLHETIIIRKKDTGERLRTTIGRSIFNSILPEKLRYINEVVGKGKLKNLIKDCLYVYGEEATVKFIDDLKDKSFSFITRSGLSWGFGDLPYFAEKDELIDTANKKVELIQDQFEEGLLTESERYSKVVETWTETKDKIAEICKAGLINVLPVFSMIESGARGSWAQPVQILGMKGLVTSPSGSIIELPVKGNFKQGFGVLEYFISTHGVRKGLSDTALRTANAGYLTRRLVDVSQDIIITSEDCKDDKGMFMSKAESEKIGTDIIKRLAGRYLAKDLKNATGKTLFKAGELMDEEHVKKIQGEDIEEAYARSVLSCKLPKGVCSKCYGYDLAFNKPVKIGTTVGTIAAQSIGEPGTQLTMRTFHSGGVAGQEDITQGLPRVEEIFESRPPKKKGLLSEHDGRITIETAKKTIVDKNGKEILVDNPKTKLLNLHFKGTTSDKYYFSEAINEYKLESGKTGVKKVEPKVKIKDGDKVSKGEDLFTVGAKATKAKAGGIAQVTDKYIGVLREVEKIQQFSIPRGTVLFVKDGEQIKKGDQLTEGSLDLKELYRLRGRLDTQKYIIKEIQYVYSSQGQPLNDKHIEIIAKQMFSRHLIIDSGDTNLLPGEVIEEGVLITANKAVKKPAKTERLLLGITKSSLTTDSFLSAASFQETPRVLIEAAINGKIDYLDGLKENVIIGCLIPAGTGYKGRKKREVYE